MYEEWKTKYKHSKDSLKPNKKLIKQNTLHFNDVDVKEFNKIYQYCKHNYLLVPSTRSKGICNSVKYRFRERFMVNVGNQTFELVIVCLEGCFRFVLKNKPSKDNTIPGRKACIEIYKKAREFKIDFSKYAQGTKEIKQEIVPPHIKFLLHERFFGTILNDCHHLDLNSAYASQIVKKYPELKPMYDDIYKKRKENNGYYKHVLTNSIGCWQSEYCVNESNMRTTKPYEFVNLSKVAINETRACIEELIVKLRKKGCVPILTNLDGIWYTGPIYHDANEGKELGQWKNDHINCKLLVKSKGAYQYLENGVCHSVVRGTSNLDLVHEREDWKFGEILDKNLKIEKYKFDKDKGVVKVWQNI